MKMPSTRLSDEIGVKPCTRDEGTVGDSLAADYLIREKIFATYVSGAG